MWFIELYKNVELSNCRNDMSCPRAMNGFSPTPMAVFVRVIIFLDAYATDRHWTGPPVCSVRRLTITTLAYLLFDGIRHHFCHCVEAEQNQFTMLPFVRDIINNDTIWSSTVLKMSERRSKDLCAELFLWRYEPVRRTGKSDDWLTIFCSHNKVDCSEIPIILSNLLCRYFFHWIMAHFNFVISQNGKWGHVIIFLLKFQ